MHSGRKPVPASWAERLIAGTSKTAPGKRTTERTTGALHTQVPRSSTAQTNAGFPTPAPQNQPPGGRTVRSLISAPARRPHQAPEGLQTPDLGKQFQIDVLNTQAPPDQLPGLRFPEDPIPAQHKRQESQRVAGVPMPALRKTWVGLLWTRLRSAPQLPAIPPQQQIKPPASRQPSIRLGATKARLLGSWEQLGCVSWLLWWDGLQQTQAHLHLGR